jgi:hypothetical protein
MTTELEPNSDNEYRGKGAEVADDELPPVVSGTAPVAENAPTSPLKSPISFVPEASPPKKLGIVSITKEEKARIQKSYEALAMAKARAADLFVESKLKEQEAFQVLQFAAHNNENAIKSAAEAHGIDLDEQRRDPLVRWEIDLPEECFRRHVRATPPNSPRRVK